MSQYYSSSRKRRERQKEKQVGQTFILLAVLGAIALVLFFLLPAIKTGTLIERPINKAETTTAIQVVPDGYARLNPKCKPERIGVVHQLEELLQTARQTDGNIPTYIRQKVDAMLADIDSGEICMYSEQMLNVITPRKMMAMGTKSLYIYLQSLSPNEPDYSRKVLIGITHERLHYEDDLPDTLENYVNGEIAVRKRVCDNGVFPWMALESGYIPYSGECEEYHHNPIEWEQSVAKDYTEDWEAFGRYVK